METQQQKQPRGRPPKSVEERKSERLEVRADSAEKSELQRAADLASMKLSDWIRDRLKAAAKRELRKTEQ